MPNPYNPHAWLRDNQTLDRGLEQSQVRTTWDTQQDGGAGAGGAPPLPPGPATGQALPAGQFPRTQGFRRAEVTRSGWEEDDEDFDELEDEEEPGSEDSEAKCVGAAHAAAPAAPDLLPACCSGRAPAQPRRASAAGALTPALACAPCRKKDADFVVGEEEEADEDDDEALLGAPGRCCSGRRMGETGLGRVRQRRCACDGVPPPRVGGDGRKVRLAIRLGPPRVLRTRR